MGKLSVTASTEVNTPADTAWKIIGPEFLKIQDWGRGISRSWNNEAVQAAHAGAPAGGRFCDLGKFGIADERILHYSDAEREITWSATSDKLPGFLKNLQNALSVESTGANSCRVHSNITADLTGVGGLLLGGPIKGNFGKLLKGFVKDWKVYAETGMASDTKKREMAALAEKK